MTKYELIDRVYSTVKDRNIPKTAVHEVCDNLFHELSKGIKKDKRFSYPGFGTWTVKARKARRGRNPQTGEEIKIKASKTVGFKPCPTFKSNVN